MLFINFEFCNLICGILFSEDITVDRDKLTGGQIVHSYFFLFDNGLPEQVLVYVSCDWESFFLQSCALFIVSTDCISI